MSKKYCLCFFVIAFSIFSSSRPSVVKLISTNLGLNPLCITEKIFELQLRGVQ